MLVMVVQNIIPVRATDDKINT